MIGVCDLNDFDIHWLEITDREDEQWRRMKPA